MKKILSLLFIFVFAIAVGGVGLFLTGCDKKGENPNPDSSQVVVDDDKGEDGEIGSDPEEMQVAGQKAEEGDEQTEANATVDIDITLNVRHILGDGVYNYSNRAYLSSIYLNKDTSTCWYWPKSPSVSYHSEVSSSGGTSTDHLYVSGVYYFHLDYYFLLFSNMDKLWLQAYANGYSYDTFFGCGSTAPSTSNWESSYTTNYGNRYWYFYNSTNTTTSSTANSNAGSSLKGTYYFTFRRKYTITYSGNGGSVPVSSATAYAHRPYTISSTYPTRTGYTFNNYYCSNGSYYNPGGTIAASSITANRTLTAQWTINTYTLTVKYYSSNVSNATNIKATQSSCTISGEASSGNSLTVKHTYYTSSRTVTIAAANTSYSYYIAVGSTPSTSSAVGSTTYSWTPNSNTTINVYIKQRYTITYAKGTGNWSATLPSTQYKAYGTDVDVYASPASATGYQFVCYSTNANGTGTQYTPGEAYKNNSNVTLYTQYQPVVSDLIFSNNGGSGATTGISGVQVFTPYRFELNSNDYYESQNFGIHYSFAIAKVTFSTTAANETVTFQYINSGEGSCDFGIFGALDKTMDYSYATTDPNQHLKITTNSTSAYTTSYSVATAGSHFIYVKYRKDVSVNSGNDSLQFKCTTHQINVTSPYQTFVNSSGYYETKNNGIHSSYAMSKIQFTATAGATLNIDYICYAESGFDYVQFGNVDAVLDEHYSSATNVNTSVTSSSSSVRRFSYTNLTAGTHFVYIKYRKDTSANSGNDNLQFKIYGTKAYGVAYGTLPTPSRSYYTFQGWGTGTGSGVNVYNTTVCDTTSNSTIYAQWNAVSVTTTVYIYTYNKAGTASNSATGGSASITYTKVASGVASAASATLSAASTSYYAHAGSSFNISANPASGYVLVGIGTSTTSTATSAPSSVYSTTLGSSAKTIYICFRQVGAQAVYKDGSNYLYTNYGEAPQTYADKIQSGLNATLRNTAAASTMTFFGKTYSTVNHSTGTYVRVAYNGANYHYRIEPIKWWVKTTTSGSYGATTTSVDAITDKILIASVYNASQSVAEGWGYTSSDLYKWTEAAQSTFKFSSNLASTSREYMAYGAANTDGVPSTSSTNKTTVQVASLKEIQNIEYSGGDGGHNAIYTDFAACVAGLGYQTSDLYRDFWTRDLDRRRPNAISATTAKSGSSYALTTIGSYVDEVKGVRFVARFSELTRL